MDAEVFVWPAQWFGGCIFRYDPEGKEQQRLQIQASQTSSFTFAGDDLADIFITSAALTDALSLAPRNYLPESGNVGSQLFPVNLGMAREHSKSLVAAVFDWSSFT